VTLKKQHISQFSVTIVKYLRQVTFDIKSFRGSREESAYAHSSEGPIDCVTSWEMAMVGVHVEASKHIAI
jgi:hypothetical protein